MPGQSSDSQIRHISNISVSLNTADSLLPGASSPVARL
jgi:hypothetical protein